MAGRQSRWEEYGPFGNTLRTGGETTFDGDGRSVKQAKLSQLFSGGAWGNWFAHTIDRYIYSSVTGQKVTSLDSYGAHYRTHVYLGSARIADELNGGRLFNVTDPHSGSTRETDATGATFPGDEEETRNELAGLATSVPHTQPVTMPPPNYARGGYVGSAEGNCIDDDSQQPMPCNVYVMLQIYKQTTARRKDKKKRPTLKRTTKEQMKARKKKADEQRRKNPKIFDETSNDEPSDFVTNPRFVAHLDTELNLARRVIEIADYARDSKGCAEAFRSVNAVPIGEQMNNTTIVTQGVFSDPTHDSKWGPDDDGKFANDLRGALAEHTNYLGFVGPSDLTQDGEYMGRRFIGLTVTGIKETKFRLSTTIIHSFLHSGGVPRDPDTGTRVDLKISVEKHDEIIEQCRKKQ